MLCNNNTEHYQKIYMIEILCICGTFQWYEWKHNISTEVKPTLELRQSCSKLFTRRLCQRSATPAQSGSTISCSYGRRISVYAHWSSPGKHFLNEMLKLCNFWFTASRFYSLSILFILCNSIGLKFYKKFHRRWKWLRNDGFCWKWTW